MFILTPLTWCYFRQNGGDGVQTCDTFASTVVGGRPFCDGHAQIVNSAMDENEVTLVPYLQAEQSDERLIVRDD